MTSLNKVLENLDTIQNQGNIEEAIEYARKINGPLLCYEDYKEIRNKLRTINHENNILLTNELRSSSYESRMNLNKDFTLLTNEMLNIQENYEDDFI